MVIIVLVFIFKHSVDGYCTCILFGKIEQIITPFVTLDTAFNQKKTVLGDIIKDGGVVNDA